MKTSRATLLLASTAIAAAPLSSSDVGAETMQVTATVLDACAIDSVAAMAFDDYEPEQEFTEDSSATIDITCTAESDVIISLDQGTNFDGTNRAMKNGTEDLLYYELYSDDRNDIWGDDTYGVAQHYTLGNDTHTLTVQGTIFSNQNVTGGNYTDTINVSLSFE